MKNEKLTESKIWRWAFFALAALGLVIIVVLAQDAGMSGDEHFHYEQAENVYNYYKTFGKDSTAAVVTEKYNLPFYGQSVDNFAYFITKTFNIENVYGARHIINSIFGWLAMLFVGLIAYRVAGWRAAVISFILIFLSPRFLGHSFNNLKDLPLATGMVMGVYFMVCFFQEFPKIRIKTATFLALAIAFAISVRIGGLLLFAYFGLFGAILYFIRNRKVLFSKQSKQELIKMLGWGIGIAFVAFILAVLTWPFALKAPIDNMKETLGSMSQFATAIRQVFEGQMQWSDLLPGYYTPKFIFSSIPIAVILGLTSFFIMGWKEKKNYFIYSLIIFSFIFPIFWIVYQNSNVYGGWRHAMFAYPTMVVAAGLGFNLAIEWVTQKVIKKNGN